MNLLEQAQLRWKSLNLREKYLLLIGGVILALVLLYTQIYAPISDAIDNQVQKLEDAEDTLKYLMEVAPKAKSMAQAKPIDTTTLLGLIQDELSKPLFKPFPYHLSQYNQDDVDIKFDQVPFNQLMMWLWRLSENHSLEIKLIEIQKTPTAGVCQAHLVLKAM